MERCPQCRARLKGRTICERCGIDLGLVLGIEAGAERLARQAVHSLATGDLQVAAEQAVSARDLHATLFHRVLSGFIES